MLWPLPTGNIVTGTEVVALDVSKIVLGHTTQGASEPLQKAYFETFRANVAQLYPDATRTSSHYEMVVNLNLASPNLHTISIDVDESYELKLSSQTSPSGAPQVVADVSARSVFGARHALETLSQLTAWDDLAAVPVVLKTASVVDAPKFRYRGVLLDLSRHFLPLDTILTTIKALVYTYLCI
jgi:hexosaminidase